MRHLGRFLVGHHEPDKPDSFDFLEKGAFNISFQMSYKNTSSAIIRLPQPGATMFPEEKVRNEVATMRYILDQTSKKKDLQNDGHLLKMAPFKFGATISDQGMSFSARTQKLPQSWIGSSHTLPVEFSYAPPWWPLIENPEYWPTEGGLEDWCTEFERRLETFLKAMINREDEAIRKGQNDNQRLSGQCERAGRVGFAGLRMLQGTISRSMRYTGKRSIGDFSDQLCALTLPMHEKRGLSI